MLNGILQASSVASTKLKAAGNTDSTYSFQSVCILYNFSLYRLRSFSPVFAKVEEELQEVKQEIARSPQDPAKIEEEIGDLFFATVNLSRHLKCSAEESLRKANQKFEQRFRRVEAKLSAQNRTLAEASLEEMDRLWDDVKREEKHR